ncbi:MAG: flagellar filament capping protein FliD [Syntrophomonadaceae bacterium]|nr:flagellar filament capping protein FliD [Syntrophomonadaceae bacterium]
MYGISNIRFGGIASGLDTDGIVKKLMQVEQMKIDRFQQQKTLLEWKRADYRSINNQLRTFREGASWNLSMEKTFMSKMATTTNDSFFNVTATNNAAAGNYSFEVKQLAEGVTVAGDLTGKSVEDFFTENNIEEVTFAINGQDVTISKGDDYTDIVDKINALSAETGVRAIYEGSMERFFLFTEATGVGAKIEITDNNSFTNQVLGLEESVNQTGKNAIMAFNGIDLEFTSNSFEFIGLNFDLKKAALGEIVNVQVSNNVDQIVDEIKAFVETYNNIIDDLGTKLSEKRYRDFPPLTEEQKADMKEKDIEAWEEKARSGLFRTDPLLSNIASDMRMTVGNAVTGLEGKYKTLSSIGITTSPDWKDNGKLYIDEDKLRAALAEDPDGVAKIFNNDEANSQGIAKQLNSKITGYFEKIATTAGRATDIYDESYLGKEIMNMDERIDTMQLRMQMLEEKYWRQFAAMETALQQMQSQGDWIAAQLGVGLA